MSMKEIYSETIIITDLFDDKSVKSFSTWCGMAKLDFVAVEQQRKYQKNDQKTRRRLLWVLKKEHRGKEDASTRLRLLESMVDRLVQNSSVDMVFASYSCRSKQPFADRDTANPIHVPKTSGNTQDMLQFLSTSSKPIAIVVVDFAGLTTNTNDLIQWLQDYETVRFALIDNIEAFNQTFTFTRCHGCKIYNLIQ
ncbi:uncharacterized protein BX663DRAFT_432369 [Cokeromyces recurvatus]|uniref:uncharacterized protein n=1 Tax=Cokeromyces recurvatus TaxID=90255 RepID=UPI00221F6699|nr:uncharacterized protein BX663DRAFT_432369 [Cokeromyces recurvatus]KAI7904051.1 hypothetical protein BX663DRAFT_432369 [Cokeromyces recurvatus]